MKYCSDCNSEINGNNVCPNCGLVDEEQQLVNQVFYPHDKERIQHYGDPLTISVSDIALMTKVNLNEIYDQDFKRAVQWDRKFGWNVEKAEIAIHEIKKICIDLSINEYVRDYCIWLFKKKIMNSINLVGKKIEILCLALVYLVIRIKNLPYTFFDFTEAGYSTEKVLPFYVFLLKELKMRPHIKQQDIKSFLSKFLNSLILDSPDTYRVKFELAILLKNIFYGIISHSLEYSDLGRNLAVFGAITYLALKRLKHPSIIIENLTQTTVAHACQTTEVTLREYVKKIKEVFNRFEQQVI